MQPGPALRQPSPPNQSGSPAMHETELRFIEIAKRHALVGMQAARALNEEQDRLQLELVLSQERLASPEGTAQSLATLAQLDEFMAVHQAAFEQVARSCILELSGALAELPPALQEKYRTGMLASIDWQLGAQRLLYRNRERWIAAAREICQLIDACRDAVVFADDGMGFVNEEDLQRVEALFATIEEVHQSEVKQLHERSQRLARSMACLEQVVPV